jgi:GNAT superfamily N-acetyltransferase
VDGDSEMLDLDLLPANVSGIIEKTAQSIVSDVEKSTGEGEKVPASAIQQVFSGSGKAPAKKQRQTAITNFFGTAAKPLPAKADWSFVDDPVVLNAPAHSEITVKEVSDQEFSAIVIPRADEDGVPEQYGEPPQVGELTLWVDDEGYWVNHVEVHERYRRRGIATMLVKAACKRHGKIYFSRQTKDQCTDDDDTRYMTDDGAALASKLVDSWDSDVEVSIEMPGAVRTAPRPETSEDSDESEESEGSEGSERSQTPETMETTETAVTGENNDDDDQMYY